MKRLAIILITSLVLAGVGVSFDAQAQNRELLGERHVSDRTETDTISVGKSRGAFKSIQFKATGARIEFKRVVVHFENGSEQVFEKNRVLGKGDTSRKIDLEGGARFIDKIVFYYEARTVGWKGADIKVWGIR
ncbi:MAG: hypothetical protein ACI9H8_000305 [Lysobacterales bacterium]|jgi:hypothetical protein